MFTQTGCVCVYHSEHLTLIYNVCMNVLMYECMYACMHVCMFKMSAETQATFNKLYI